MSAELTCSVCGAVNGFGDEHAGQMGKCGQCQTPLYVPRREEMPPASIGRVVRKGGKGRNKWVLTAAVVVVGVFAVVVAASAYSRWRFLEESERAAEAKSSAGNNQAGDNVKAHGAPDSGQKLVAASKEGDKPTESKKEQKAKEEVKDPFAAARPVYVNAAAATTEYGSLADAKDENVYKFNAPAAGTLVVNFDPVDGSSLEGQLVALDGQRQQIARNGANPEKRVSQILFPVEAGKDYYLKVAGFDGTSGKYKTTFTHVTDVPAAFDKALQVRLSRTGSAVQSWNIAAAGNENMFKLVAPVTGWLFVDMKTDQSKLAAKLAAYDSWRMSPGSALLKNGNNGSRHLRIFVEAGLTYYVKAAAWTKPLAGLYSTGPYTLVFHTQKADLDDHGNNFATATEVFLKTLESTTVQGCIETPLDIDFFRFTPGVSGTLTVELTPTLESKLAARTYAYNFSRLAVGTGGGMSLLTIPVFAGSTYYVKVLPALSTPTGLAKTGAYFLTFRLQSTGPVAGVPPFNPVPGQGKNMFENPKPFNPLLPVPPSPNIFDTNPQIKPFSPFPAPPSKNIFDNPSPFAKPFTPAPIDPIFKGNAFTTAPGQFPDMTVARNKLVNWLKTNDRFGPDTDFIRQMSQLLDQEIYKCNNLALLVGQNSTKSGRAYSVDMWAGSVFASELTDDQAARMGIKPNSVSCRTGMKKLDRKLAFLPITIKDVTIYQADKLKGEQKITGQLAYEVVGTVTSQKLNIRLSYMRENTTVSGYVPLTGLAGKTGTLNFSFGSVNRSGEKEYLGPLVVFVELATMTDRANFDFDIAICSNTTAQIVEVVANK